MQTTHLNHKHLHTLSQIFQHPTSHSLEWHDVIALMEHLGKVEEKDNGNVTFAIKDVSRVFHRPQGKEISETEQVLDLRHFLRSAGVGKYGVNASKVTEGEEKLRLLVVVSQQETLVFRSEDKDAVPEHIHPFDPHGLLHRLNHTRGGDFGSRLPENLAYYKDIAQTLTGADEILLMGNGTGASSAMGHLEDFLATNHPELAQKIVGTLKLDLEALTEGQLLQEARRFFMRQDSPETDKN